MTRTRTGRFKPRIYLCKCGRVHVETTRTRTTLTVEELKARLRSVYESRVRAIPQINVMSEETG